MTLTSGIGVPHTRAAHDADLVLGDDWVALDTAEDIEIRA